MPTFSSNFGALDSLAGGGGGGEDLAATLLLGNITGGTGIEVTSGDPLLLNENTTVPGGAPGATQGVIWVQDTVPTTLVFTDGGGTDFLIGGTGAPDIVGPGSSTDNALVRWNSTGGDLTKDSTAILDNSGNLTVNGNVTVTGLIDDANGLVLEGQASVPGGVPAATYGTFWVDDTGSPSLPKFTDDAGTDHNLAGTLAETLVAGNITGGTDIEVTGTDAIIGAVASTLNVHGADATAGDADPAIFRGGDRTGLGAGSGGDVTVRGGLGLTTSDAGGIVTVRGGDVTDGGTAGELRLFGGDGVSISISTPGADVVLRGGSGATFGGADGDIILDYATWPATDGGAGTQLTTNGAGVLSWSVASSPSLQLAYAGGNTIVTNATDGAFDVSGTETISLDASAASNFTVDSAGLTLATTSGGILTLSGSGLMDVNAAASLDIDVTGTFDMLSTGAFSIDGTGPSNVSAASGTLTLSTSASGNVAITAAADITLSPASGQLTTINGLRTQVNRVQHDLGTALVSGDFALSAGWGTTATVSAVSGTDSRFVFTVSPGGAGLASSPTITFTYKDGAWPNAPFPLLIDNGSIDGAGGYFAPAFELTSSTTTTAVWTLRNAITAGVSPYTPAAGDIFKMIVHVLG